MRAELIMHTHETIRMQPAVPLELHLASWKLEGGTTQGNNRSAASSQTFAFKQVLCSSSAISRKAWVNGTEFSSAS